MIACTTQWHLQLGALLSDDIRIILCISASCRYVMARAWATLETISSSSEFHDQMQTPENYQPPTCVGNLPLERQIPYAKKIVTCSGVVKALSANRDAHTYTHTYTHTHTACTHMHGPLQACAFSAGNVSHYDCRSLIDHAWHNRSNIQLMSIFGRHFPNSKHARWHSDHATQRLFNVVVWPILKNSLPMLKSVCSAPYLLECAGAQVNPAWVCFVSPNQWHVTWRLKVHWENTWKLPSF